MENSDANVIICTKSDIGVPEVEKDQQTNVIPLKKSVSTKLLDNS